MTNATLQGQHGNGHDNYNKSIRTCHWNNGNDIIAMTTWKRQDGNCNITMESWQWRHGNGAIAGNGNMGMTT